MNLFYMLERRDKNAAFGGDLQRVTEKVQGGAWRGIDNVGRVVDNRSRRAQAPHAEVQWWLALAQALACPRLRNAGEGMWRGFEDVGRWQTDSHHADRMLQ
jgi:hypothetical protein